MSAPVIGVIPPGRIFAYGDLYSVPRDSVADGVLVVSTALGFHKPRDSAEYVRSLGFLFNGPDLASLWRA